jgi:rod shape-determining protein MreC
MKYYRKKKETKTKRIMLAAVIFIAAGSLVFVLFSVKGAAKLSNITSLAVDPIVSLFRNTKTWITEGFESFSNNKELIKENKELRDRISEQEAKNLLVELYKDEIDEYKQLLNLQKELYNFQLIYANAIYTTIGNLQTGMTINKGIGDGVAKGMPVLYGDKLLGIVESVDLISARVRTLYEKDFTVIARNSVNHEILRVRGDSTAYLNQLLICDYMPLRSGTKVGDTIETSVLGEVYPDSIKIGTVEKIDYDSDGLPVKAYIRPYIDPNVIDAVYVLSYKELEGE